MAEEFDEQRAEAATEATSERNRRVKIIPRIVWPSLGVMCLLLVTYWVFNPAEVAERQAAAAQQKAAQELTHRQQELARVTEENPQWRVCQSVKTRWHFGTEKPDKAFNPAGQCIGYLWYDSHCIYLQRAGKDRPEGQLCDPKLKGGSGLAVLPNDGEYVWSADTPFDGYVRLDPPSNSLPHPGSSYAGLEARVGIGIRH